MNPRLDSDLEVLSDNPLDDSFLASDLSVKHRVII